MCPNRELFHAEYPCALAVEVEEDATVADGKGFPRIEVHEALRAESAELDAQRRDTLVVGKNIQLMLDAMRFF